MPLGLYLSVPFCRTKCSFCNFASGVFSRPLFDQYIRHLESELARAEQVAEEMGGIFERELDSIYLGGGTPSVLAPDQLAALFRAVLVLHGVEAPVVKPDCVRATVRLLKLDGAPFERIFAIRSTGELPATDKEANDLFASYLLQIESVVEAVDETKF